MSKRQYPTQEYVRQCFRYENGKLYWLNRPREHFKSDGAWRRFNTTWAGKEAGHRSYLIGGDRYYIRLDARGYLRSRLVWCFHNGDMPNVVDHKNRNQLDDSFSNLRVATQTLNMGNCKRRKDNISGVKGVGWDATNGKWVARIQVDGKRIHLGRFATAEEAHAAYFLAARQYFGEFACSG